MADLKYTVCINSPQGSRFLCSLSSFCCGDRYLGYFDLNRSCAMPMSLDQAIMLRDYFRVYMRGYDYYVIPVPWEPAPSEEVSGNV